jgi:hypothetical protein
MLKATLVASLLFTSFVVQAQSTVLPSSFSDGELKSRAQAFLRIVENKERASAAVSIQAAEFAGYVAGHLDARTDGPSPDAKLAECMRKMSLALVTKRAATIIADSGSPGSGSARFEIGFAIVMACKEDAWNKPSVANSSAGWQKFGENDRLVAYYQPRPVPGMDTQIVWVMYDYKTEQESQRSGRRYRSQKGQQEVNCAQERTRTVFFTWHSGQMGNGPVVYTGHSALPWEPNSPNSLAKALASVLCIQR